MAFSRQNGADVNAKDMLKMTALHWATERLHQDVVRLLLHYGADVHASSKFDKSAFDIALEKNDADILVILQVWFFLIPQHVPQLNFSDFYGTGSRLNISYLSMSRSRDAFISFLPCCFGSAVLGGYAWL